MGLYFIMRGGSMSEFDIYVFILCLIVFLLLTITFSYFIITITKLMIRLIRSGAEDENLLKEYNCKKEKRLSIRIVDFLVSTVVCLLLIVAFTFSMFVNLQENVYFKNIPTLKVVTSSSMSFKYKNNDYLFENSLDDQVERYDLIFTYRVPAEKELQLYDIVVYEVEDVMVLHRIVGIEEPNEKHPNERYFLCQGDAVEYPDRFPVLYSQIHGIYKGERIPFVGSFIFFMQSPAGWLCILLVIFTMIITPVIDKKMEKEKIKRLNILTNDINAKKISDHI